MSDSELVIRRFAIIGAGGAAGLAAMKVASEELREQIEQGSCELVGFEQREDVGGVWLASPKSVVAEEAPFSAIYDCLTTNIPHPIMYYHSRLAAPSSSLFSDALVVQNYLKDFARQFRLLESICFDTRVVSATWSHSADRWNVVHQKHGLCVT